MKIRAGFVSNSSSTSFICYGKSVNISKIEINYIKDAKYINKIIAIGDVHVSD